MPSSSSSIYNYKPGGALKFKGGESLPSSSSKKKKKSKAKSSTSQNVRHGEDYVSSSRDQNEKGKERKDEKDTVEDDIRDEDRRDLKMTRNMTESERKFEEIRRKRMTDRVEKQANLSHKDRVDQFNKSLADRTEHNDMLTVAGH